MNVFRKKNKKDETMEVTKSCLSDDGSRDEHDNPIRKVSKVQKHIDATGAIKEISAQLNQTEISKLDLEIISVNIFDTELDDESDKVSVNSKYRILINRRNREREISACHEISLKNMENPSESKMIKICLRLHAYNCDSSKHNNLLMQWSLFAAEHIIKTDPDLNIYIPGTEKINRLDDMILSTEHFDGCIICATTKKEIPVGLVSQHSTTPLTDKVVKGFSDDNRNENPVAVTITNFNNL